MPISALQLPPSTPLAFAITTDRSGCFSAFPAPPLTQANAAQLTNTFSSVDPCSLNFNNTQVLNYLPANSFANSQAGLRARMKLGDLDLALSYYYGRFSFPVALDAVARTSQSSIPAEDSTLLTPRR